MNENLHRDSDQTDLCLTWPEDGRMLKRVATII
jgi:hypothetical protein